MADWGLAGLLLLGLSQSLDLAPDESARRSEAIRGRFGKGPRFPFGPGLDVISTPRFLWIEDQARALPAAPWTTEEAWGEAFEMARSAWDAREPDGARALVVFATFEAGDRELFYVALANDVQGLGSGDEAEIFDASPGSPLEGYVWMGSLESLDAAGPDFATEAFLHELAHRWCVYLRLGATLPSDLLLGRNLTHWSFFADTGNSPMEGNRWEAVDAERFTTSFDELPRFAFSPLDLYLMGVLPPEAVPNFAVLRGPVTQVLPSWFRPRAEEPPAHRLDLSVSLRPTGVSMVSMDDVIRANGPRIPAAREPETPIERPIGIVLLSDGHTNPELELFAGFDARIQAWSAAFAEATGQRMTVGVELQSAGRGGLGAPCQSVDDCDRTVSDRCVANPDRGASCSRSCLFHPECGGGCCVGDSVPGLCQPRPTGEPCGPPPRVPGDAGLPTAIDGGREEPKGDLDPAPSGCSCGALRSKSDRGEGLLLLLGLAALRRRGRGYRRGFRRPRREARRSTG